MCARVGAAIVVDAFAAMTAERPYRAARTSAAALAELRDCSGSQFDPRVVEAFGAMARRAARPFVRSSRC